MSYECYECGVDRGGSGMREDGNCIQCGPVTKKKLKARIDELSERNSIISAHATKLQRRLDAIVAVLERRDDIVSDGHAEAETELHSANLRIAELETALAPAPNTIPVPRASVLVQIYRNVYAAGLDGTGRRITAWDELTPSEQALQESAMDAVLAALSPFLAPASNVESLQTQLDQAHRERLNAEQAIDRIEVARQAEKEALRNNHANELQGLRALLADAERRVTRLTRDNEVLQAKMVGS